MTGKQRLEQGNVPSRKDGRTTKYDKRLAIEAIVSKGGGGVENEAKERRALADAEKAELLVSRLKGELVPVADMKTAAAQLIKTLYARTVRVTPSLLAPQIIGKTDVLEIEGILRDALADVFNELKSMPDQFLTVEEDDEALEESVSLAEDVPEEPPVERKKLSISID